MLKVFLFFALRKEAGKMTRKGGRNLVQSAGIEKKVCYIRKINQDKFDPNLRDQMSSFGFFFKKVFIGDLIMHYSTQCIFSIGFP